MTIEFDREKDAANLRKHGFSLQLAAVLFEGPYDIELDDRFDYGEHRWNATGLILDRIFVCIYTERGDDVFRIISLRARNPERNRCLS